MTETGTDRRRRPRVLISHQGCIPIYRRPLFERLARIPDIEYVVAYGDPPRGTNYIIAKPPYAFPTLRIDNRQWGLGGASVVWQPLVCTFWRDFDAAILGDEIKYASHLAIIAAARLTGRPVLLWGFGYPEGQRDSDDMSRSARLQRRLKSTFRRIELRGLDGYLAYTTSGSHSLRKAGVSAARIAIVHNTIDVEHQGALHASAKAEGEAALRACLGLPAGVPVLVFLGRHIRDKCIDLLVDYARRSTSVGRDLRVLVFGEGPEKPALIARAQGLDSIAFLPPDDLQQARALALAAAVVIPGFSGLAIPHAFAHHVPFLTREGIVHPPEIDYLRNGGNGLLLPHAPEAFFAALDKYLDDAPLQARLARGAAETAAGLSMDAMAAAYDGLVRRLLEARGRMPQSAASAVSSPAPGSAA